eukprot:TRINITY_DN8113_c0_g1_i1.p1 TRINITY_DN8113_c0_g1~~TRINITY_DN8113_c0_g1_i1.p1  ORF type:complete len:3618 (+),score=1020.05 TRINITY_DN8113_c0_g1_i1:77-10930(+)
MSLGSGWGPAPCRLLFLLYYLHGSSACLQGWTLYEYKDAAGNPAQTCFIYVNTSVLTWTAARDYCGGQGGRLATLAAAGDAAFIASMIIPARGSPWVGGFYSGTAWQWLDPVVPMPQSGTANVAYTPWRYHRPELTPPGAKRCSQLGRTAQPPYTQIQERECSALGFFVCQAPPLPPKGVAFDGVQQTLVLTRNTMVLKLIILDEQGKNATGVDRSTVNVTVHAGVPGGMLVQGFSPAAAFSYGRRQVTLRCVFAGNYQVKIETALQGGFISDPPYLNITVHCVDNPEIEQYPVTVVVPDAAKALMQCVDDEATAAALAEQDVLWESLGDVAENMTRPDVTVHKSCPAEAYNHYWDTPPEALLGKPEHYDTAALRWYRGCSPLNDSTTYSPEVAGSFTIRLRFDAPVLFRRLSIFVNFGTQFITGASLVTLSEEGRSAAALRTIEQELAAAAELTQTGDLPLPGTIVPKVAALLQVCWQLCRQLVTCAGLHVQESHRRCQVFTEVTESVRSLGYTSARGTVAPDGSSAFQIAADVRLRGIVAEAEAIRAALSLPQGVLAFGADFIVPTNETDVSQFTPPPPNVTAPPAAANYTTPTLTVVNSTGVCLSLGPTQLTITDQCQILTRRTAFDWDQCLALALASGADYISVDDVGRCNALVGSCYARTYSGTHQSARLKCSQPCANYPGIVLDTSLPDCREITNWQTEAVDECADRAVSVGAEWYQHRSGLCVAAAGSCSHRLVDITSTAARMRCTGTGSSDLSAIRFFSGPSEPTDCPAVAHMSIAGQLSITLGREVWLDLRYPGPVAAWQAAAPTLPQLDSVVLVGEQAVPVWQTNPAQGDAVFGLPLTLRFTGSDFDLTMDEYLLVREPAGGLSWAEQLVQCARLASGQQYFLLGEWSFLQTTRSDIGSPERAAWYTVCFAYRGIQPFIPVRPHDYCGAGQSVLQCGETNSASLQTTPPPVRIQWRDNEPPTPTGKVGVGFPVRVQQIDARNAIVQYSASTSIDYFTALIVNGAADFDTTAVPIFVTDVQPMAGGYGGATITFLRPGLTRLRAVGSWSFHNIRVDYPWAEAVVMVEVGDPYKFRVASFPENPTTVTRNLLRIEILDWAGNIVTTDSRSTCRVSVNPPQAALYAGGLAFANEGIIEMRIVFASAWPSVELAVLPQFHSGLVPVQQVITFNRTVSLYAGVTIETPTVRIAFTGGTVGSLLDLRRAVGTLLDVQLSVVTATVTTERHASSLQRQVWVVVDIPVYAETADFVSFTSIKIDAALSDPSSPISAFTAATVTAGARIVATTPPKIVLTPPQQLAGRTTAKISADKKLVLRANVTHPAPFYTVWSSPDIDLYSLAPDELLTEATALDLVLAPGVLTEGKVYFFAISAEDSRSATREVCGSSRTLGQAIPAASDCELARPTLHRADWDSCQIAAATSGADYLSLSSSGECQLLRGVCANRTADANGTWAHLCGQELLASTAGLSLVVNSPPKKGPLVVSPLQGEALETNFSLGACDPRWTDEPDDYPLRFRFHYSRKGRAQEGDTREACGSLLRGRVGGPDCHGLQAVASGDPDSCEAMALAAGADFWTYDESAADANCLMYLGECSTNYDLLPGNVSNDTAAPSAAPNPNVSIVPPPTTTLTLTMTLDGSSTALIVSGRICNPSVAIRTVVSTNGCAATAQLGSSGEHLFRLCVSDIWGSSTCADPVAVNVTLTQADPAKVAVALNSLDATDPQGTLAAANALNAYINEGVNGSDRAALKGGVLAAVVSSSPDASLIGETCHAVAYISSDPGDIDEAFADSAAGFLNESLGAAANGSTVLSADTGVAALDGLGSILTSEVSRAGANRTEGANTTNGNSTAGNATDANSTDSNSTGSNGTAPAGGLQSVGSVLSRVARALQGGGADVIVSTQAERERAALLDQTMSAAMQSLRLGVLMENVAGERSTSMQTADIAMEVARAAGAPQGDVSPGGLSTVEIPSTLGADMQLPAAAETDMQATEVKQDTKRIATTDAVLAPVVGFEVSDAGARGSLPIADLSNPLRIRMMRRKPTAAELIVPGGVNNDTFESYRSVMCRWWDKAAAKWSSEGCRLVPQGSLFRCGLRYDGTPVWCRRQTSGSFLEDKELLKATETATLTATLPLGRNWSEYNFRRRSSTRRRRGRVQQGALPVGDPELMEEVLCECTHATEFTVGSADDLKPKPRLPSLDLTDLSQVSPIMLGIVCGVAGAAFVSCIVLLIVDCCLTRRAVRRRAEAFGRRAVLTMSEVVTRRQGLLDEGDGAENVVVKTTNTGWGTSRDGMPPAYTDAALERPWVIDLSEVTSSRCQNLLKLYGRTCIESHIWVKALLYNISTNSNFERHQKAMVLWCLIAAGLFINSVWYQHPTEKENASLVRQMSSNVYNTISTLAVLIPSAFLLSLFFVHTPPIGLESKTTYQEMESAVLTQRRVRGAGEADALAQSGATTRRPDAIGENRFELPYEQLSAVAMEEVRHRRLHAAATVLLVRDHPDEIRRADGELGPTSVQAAITRARAMLHALRQEEHPGEKNKYEVLRNDRVHVVSSFDPAGQEFEEEFAKEELGGRWRPALRQMYNCRFAGKGTSFGHLPNQLQLAACMFQMAVLGDSPDLFYLVHREGPGGRPVREVVRMIIAHNAIGRGWAMYYAQKLLRMSPQTFWDLHEDSAEVDEADLVVIYGLETNMDPVFAGGVTYMSEVERVVETSEEHISWRDAVEEVVQGRLVDAAHYFRYAIFDVADTRRLRRAFHRPLCNEETYEWVDGEASSRPASSEDAPVPGLGNSQLLSRELTRDLSRGISSDAAARASRRLTSTLPTLPRVDRDQLISEMLGTLSGLLFVDGDPLRECSTVRSIEYGRVMARHYALLAGWTPSTFAEQYLAQQRQLEQEHTPGALRPGVKLTVITDVDELREQCSMLPPALAAKGSAGKKDPASFAGRLGEVDMVIRETPETDPVAARLIFSERPGDDRVLPVETLVYSKGDAGNVGVRAGQRVCVIAPIVVEGEKKIKIGYQGTVKRVSAHGNWLIDFDNITGKLRWVHREDLYKLSTSELQTSELGRKFADLEAGRFDALSRQERDELGVCPGQVRSNVFQPRKINMHLTYAINVCFDRNYVESPQAEWPKRGILAGNIYVCSPMHRRGNYCSPLHSWTRRGLAARGLSRGTGTRMNPFIGLEAGLLSARAGDVVIMLPGAYPPITIQECQGTEDRPLVIVSQDANPRVYHVGVANDSYKRVFVMPGVDLAAVGDDSAEALQEQQDPQQEGAEGQADGAEREEQRAEGHSDADAPRAASARTTPDPAAAATAPPAPDVAPAAGGGAAEVPTPDPVPPPDDGAAEVPAPDPIPADGAAEVPAPDPIPADGAAEVPAPDPIPAEGAADAAATPEDGQRQRTGSLAGSEELERPKLAADFTVKITAISAAAATTDTVLKLKECRNLVVAGLHVTNGKVGIDGRDGELCEVRDCRIDRVEIPHLQSAVDRHLGLSIGNVTQIIMRDAGTPLKVWLATKDYPRKAVLVGYLLCFVYFGICIILILLQTVNFQDEGKALGWLTVTAITLLIDIVLVRPTISFFKSVWKLFLHGRKLLGGRLRYVEMLSNREPPPPGTDVNDAVATKTAD